MKPKKKITVMQLAYVMFLLTVVLTPNLFFPDTSYSALFSPGSSHTKTTGPDSPWHIVADSLIYDKKAGLYTASGNVVITKDNNQISMDYMEYNPEKMDAFARGHVVASSKDYTSSADEMQMNLNSDKGTLKSGTIFIQSSHLYIKGDTIEKIGERTYTADKVTITTCDGDTPDWKISGRDLKLTIEGYGTVYHSAFWAKKMPLLYSPFFFFPVKLKRQTGFLPPAISPTSKRKGFEYFQPFFWAINDNTDATFYLRHMKKRGDLGGTEYRYILSDRTMGAFMYDFLSDTEIDDGSEESTEYWGYTDSNTRLNDKRYWFRMKHTQLLPFDISMKINADVVSDQDYLREFDDLSNGFDATKKYFKTNFGSDIEASDDAVRTNSLLFNKSWTTVSINSSLYWYDNVVARRNDTNDTTLQQLPVTNLSVAKQQLFNTPFYFDLEAEYNYFYRKDVDTSNYRGHRLDFKPGLFLPYKVQNWFSVEPFIKLRETVWHVENNFGLNASNDDIKGEHGRYLYETGVELSTDFYRIFALNIGDIDKIKHSITPKLVYNYIPEIDQTDLPNFDGTDRISQNNTMTFSITNYLTSRTIVKNKIVRPVPNEKPKYTYNQFLRFIISQTYDINEYKEDNQSEWINPLAFELDITPKQYFSLDSDWKWSKYKNDITEANVKLTLNDNRGDNLSAEYRYTIDSVESIIAGITLKATDRVSVYATKEFDFIENEAIETNTGIKYQSQCWGINLLYTDKTDERKYTITFDLLGLGSIPSKNNAETIEDLF